MRPKVIAEVKAEITFDQALLAMEYIVENSDNNIWSMWEANKLKTIVQKIEQKVTTSLEEIGITVGK